MLKIMLVNDAGNRLGRLRRALEDAGIELVAEVDGGMHLLQYIEAVQPDALLIDSDSPSRDLLEQLAVVSRNNPRPVVLFADDAGQDAIRQAIRSTGKARTIRASAGISSPRSSGSALASASLRQAFRSASSSAASSSSRACSHRSSACCARCRPWPGCRSA